MFSLSSKFVVCGAFAVALLGFAQKVSFSEAGGTVANNASTLSLSTDPAAISGYADGSEKTVVSNDDLTGQYSSPSCVTCRYRYYTQGTSYYMNYPAYMQCINSPCS